MVKNENSEVVVLLCVGVWFQYYVYSVVFSLGCVCCKLWVILLIVMVMVLVLVLLLGLLIVLDNFKQFVGSVQQLCDINVFLKSNVDGFGVFCLVGQLCDCDDVVGVNVCIFEQGLQELCDVGFGEVIDVFNDNLLFLLLVIILGQGKDDVCLVCVLESLFEVDLVQYDVLWCQCLDVWLVFGVCLVQVLLVLFGVGVVLVVGNMVCFDIQVCCEEIGVLQLFGVSDGFICCLFLYLGVWYGLGVGVVVLVLIGVVGVVLCVLLVEFLCSYGSLFVLYGLDLLYGGLVLVGMLLLGWLGVWLVIGYFFCQICLIDI